MAGLPLAGLRVLLTRPDGEGAQAWMVALASAGAIPLPYPTITAAPPESWDEIDTAVERLASYDWLIFTSQTAVAFLIGRLPGQHLPEHLPARIAAVGSKTAARVEAAGGRVALIPTLQQQEGIMHALAHLPAGTRILLPMAAGGRPLLADALSAQGCAVDVVTAYRTLAKADLPPPPPFDVATFASPSALQAFIAGPGVKALTDKVVAVIGASTAAAAKSSGLDPWVARSPSADGLIRAIAEARLKARGG
ncbi:MAG: uroporphyrinogen-III synthase [Polyangia bacterium]|jgi:uroporphyrinogen-III synthase